MRLFLAIDPDPAVVAVLAAMQAELHARLPARRWSDPACLHLTLHFLGEVDAGRVPALAELLAGVAARTLAFKLSVDGLGAFPSDAAPRVVWAGVGGDRDALAALHGALADGLVALGFSPDTRPYHPHLTLAREAAGPLPAIAPAPAAWIARELVLYQSHLGGQTGQGSRYEAIARAPLTAPP